MAPPPLQLQHLVDAQYRSPSWGTPSPSPTPIPASILASQQANSSGSQQATSLDSDRILSSIESPAPSPAPPSKTPTFSTNQEHGRKLGDAEKLVVIKICQSYARVYLNDKPQT